MLKPFGTQLNLCVIGAGHWGPNLIRAFIDHPETKVTHICDTDPERLSTLQATYPTIEHTLNWREAVSHSQTDAVIICTPTKTHFEIAEAALKHGKHVFIEKPLCHSRGASEKLCQLAMEHGVKLMVGHIFLFNNGITRLKELIHTKALGELLYLYATRTNLGPIRTDVNALWDLASHDISIFLYLLDQLPHSVQVVGSSCINPPLEDVVFGSLTFPNNTLAHFHASWLDPKKIRQVVVVGTQKMAVFDDMAAPQSLKVYEKSIGSEFSKSSIADTLSSFRKSVIEGDLTICGLPPTEPLKQECQAFVDWILRDIKPYSDGEFGLKVVSVLEQLSKTLTNK